MFKVKNKVIKTMALMEFCCFLINFERISHLLLVFLLLTLNM